MGCGSGCSAVCYWDLSESFGKYRAEKCRTSESNMTLLSYYLIIPIASLIVNAFVQGCLCRLWHGRLFFSILGGAGIGFLFLLLMVSYFSGDCIWDYVDRIFLYMCFSFWYFTALNLGETSIRLRMLDQISKRLDPLAKNGLPKGMTVEEVLVQRLQRLEANRIIRFDGDRILFRWSIFFLACLPLVGLKRLFYGSVRGQIAKTRP